jgi:hypothetical protein
MEAAVMNNALDELTLNELRSVTGGGPVDNLLAEAEAATDAYLKQFTRFMAMINSPINQAPAASQE